MAISIGQCRWHMEIEFPDITDGDRAFYDLRPGRIYKLESLSDQLAIVRRVGTRWKFPREWFLANACIPVDEMETVQEMDDDGVRGTPGKEVFGV